MPDMVYTYDADMASINKCKNSPVSCVAPYFDATSFVKKLENVVSAITYIVSVLNPSFVRRTCEIMFVFYSYKIIKL